MIYTDRSRIQAFDNCNRLRYNNYHWGGTGLVPVSLSLPLLDGALIHEAIEKVVIGEDVEDVMEEQTAKFMEEAKKGIRNNEGVPAWFIEEQQVLLRGLMLLWAKWRLPLILDEYDVVTTETELPYQLAEDIIQAMRADMVLRRRRDGLLFLMEYKTLSTAGDEWVKQWEHNSQVTSYTLAAEEQFQEPIGGVLIEGLVKGPHKKDTGKDSTMEGYRIQQSPLCYYFEDPKTDDYSLVWKKNWVKKPVRLLPKEGEITVTVDNVVAEMGEEMARKLLLPVPPIKPDAGRLAKWKKQTVAKERRIAAAVESGEDLDEAFPMNHEHCTRYWGHPCAYMELCHNGGVAADPIACGLFERRVPHHPLEIEYGTGPGVEKGTEEEASAAEAIL